MEPVVGQKVAHLLGRLGGASPLQSHPASFHHQSHLAFFTIPCPPFGAFGQCHHRHGIGSRLLFFSVGCAACGGGGGGVFFCLVLLVRNALAANLVNTKSELISLFAD